ncbi:GerMN domain-containing protein [Paractinoplanes lichenicola]|uniref:GerMN domain-containing protein n=1 Tax=Paractinoplanes lichenicola TaxID=2802976 RepID=A0ABS1VZ25_9ACTN|nr:GerMN domain-containing protein [Actinoplanes lichenicola]MBL7259741.1 GerMN domain-containing protein [Actinoplanes lichenicola]
MRKVWTITTAAAALVLGGCGVGAQDEPHPVSLPRHALTSPGPGTTETVGDVAQVICLVRDDKLVQQVRRTQTYPTPQTQLSSLVSGPTPAERNAGLTTKLSGLVLTARGITGAVATVEVPDVGESGARSDESLLFAQMVCTLTARPDVAEVRFTRDGQPLEVPLPDGSLTGSPLGSSDYADLW